MLQTKAVPPALLSTLSASASHRHRSLVLVVGDSARDTVAHLHTLLLKQQHHQHGGGASSSNSSTEVLWCYKTSDLGLSEKRKKRLSKMKRLAQRGLYEDGDPHHAAERFFATANVSYCFYKDTDKVLGKTYAMLVLQDFEALTPNILARTMETVQGGGCIVLLVKKMESLRQLYTLAMDAHSRFTTHGYSDVRPRFNERLILSLASCSSCVVIDEEFNLLPSLSSKSLLAGLRAMEEESSDHPAPAVPFLPSTLGLTDPIASLVGLCRTADQVTAVKDMLTRLVGGSSSLPSSALGAVAAGGGGGGHTFTVQASRGRGKSALLGLVIAGAVATTGSAPVHSVVVSAPQPAAVQTLFEFVVKGLVALRLVEHRDFRVITAGFSATSGTADHHHHNHQQHTTVLGVDVWDPHRRRLSVRFVDPLDSSAPTVCAAADLIVIDEAAAIPLPVVRRLLPTAHNRAMQILSSTVDGYEGTGRSLSLKLFKELKQDEAKRARTFSEVKLSEPIRYGKRDPVESWLQDLLLLREEAGGGGSDPAPGSAFPAPTDTQLFAVDRDTLFSRHRVSEHMLHRIWSLFVTSHYKNTPNDLQLLADAPAHRLYVLLSTTALSEDPQVLCAIQVAFEGTIPSDLVRKRLAAGNKESGDMIPWQVAQQFQDDGFAEARGARVVRIATHPNAMSMGYGQRAMELLVEHLQGGGRGGEEEEEEEEADDDEEFEAPTATAAVEEEDEGNLFSEKLRLRKKLRPLLVPVGDFHRRSDVRVDYVGVAFGCSPRLFEFWRKCGFRPLYMRQTANETTGEFTCIVVKPTTVASTSLQERLDGYCKDFGHRFASLLAGPFRRESATFACSVLQTAAGSGSGKPGGASLGLDKLSDLDLRRLSAYAKNLVDFHLITDLLPSLARAYFLDGAFREDLTLSPLQRVLLVAMGLQLKTVDEGEKEFSLPVQQLLGLFNKAVRRLVGAGAAPAGAGPGAGSEGEHQEHQEEPVEGQVVKVKRAKVVGADAPPRAKETKKTADRWAGRTKKHKR